MASEGTLGLEGEQRVAFGRYQKQTPIGQPPQARRWSARHLLENRLGSATLIDHHHLPGRVREPQLEVAEPQPSVTPAGNLGEHQTFEHHAMIPSHFSVRLSHRIVSTCSERTAKLQNPAIASPHAGELRRIHLLRGWVNKPLCGSSAHRFQTVNVVVRWSGVTDLLTDTCFKLGFASGKLAEVLTPGCGRSRARAYEHRHHEQGHRT